MTAQIIEFRKPVITCSFCRKPKSDIRMLQNEGTEHQVAICVECASIAKTRMEEEKK